jgi:DNA-binding XRE family transcriptional regulator
MQKTQTPAQRILDMRGDLGLNQGAPEYGVSQAAWSRIERGETTSPRIKIKKGIARKLGVTVDDIWGEPEPVEIEQPEVPEWLRGEDVTRLLDMTVDDFRQLFVKDGRVVAVETKGRLDFRDPATGCRVTLHGTGSNGNGAKPRPRARRRPQGRRMKASSSGADPDLARPASGHLNGAAS